MMNRNKDEDMQICENCFIDLTNDGIEGCPGCAHIEYENKLRKRIEELESAIKTSVPILRERAYRLNMEWYTASGKVLGDLANEFEALTNKQQK